MSLKGFASDASQRAFFMLSYEKVQQAGDHRADIYYDNYSPGFYGVAHHFLPSFVTGSDVSQRVEEGADEFLFW